MTRDLEPSRDPEPMVKVKILGQERLVPALDCWLRGFQSLGFSEPGFFFHSGFYCWNNRCKTCVFSLQRAGESEPKQVQGCLVELRDGDQVLSLPESAAWERPEDADQGAEEERL